MVNVALQCALPCYSMTLANVIYTIYFNLMRNYENQVNKDWQSMFNVQKWLFKDMYRILARLCGLSQAWLQCVYCQAPKSDYF